MSLNVLVVDDSAVMRKMLIKGMTDSGLALGEVYQAANGEEGLAVIAQKTVHVVLLDVHMPVMTGAEMFEKLRASQTHAALPVVFVSSDSSAERIRSLLDMGAGFIHKPWSPDELRAQIEEVTRG